MKRAVFAIAIVLVLIVSGLLIVPGFIDWNQHRDRIITQLEQITGHEYQIGGTLEFAILPYPRVLIEDLTISQPDDLGGAQLLSLERAAASIALWPLWRGQVEVAGVSLERPVFNLGIQADGTPNWMTPALQAHFDGTHRAEDGSQTETVALGDNITLDSITIRNGAIDFVNRQTGFELAASEINLNVRADSLMGPYTGDGRLVYNGEPMNFEIKSGRIERGAEALALQLKAVMPASRTEISYSGVISTVEPYSLQGEASIRTSNFGAMIRPFTGETPQGLDKAFQARGLLTASQQAVSMRNARFGWAGAAVEGSVTVENFDARPVRFDVRLHSDTPVDMAAFLPAPVRSSARRGGAAPQPTALTQFIPETLTLPMSMAGTFNVTLQALEYQGLTLQPLSIVAEMAERRIVAGIEAGLPGGGALDLDGTLAFGSLSVSGATGAVTLSDPRLTYRAVMQTKEPQAVLSAFVPHETLAQAGALLSSDMAVDVKGVIMPRVLNVEAGSLRLVDTQFAFSTAYALNAQRRDQLTLTASVERLDADAWLRRMQPHRGQQAATRQTQAPTADIRTIAESLALPFDLDLGARVGVLRYDGNEYRNVNARGQLAGTRLNVETLGFQDEDNNQLGLVGTVADISALNGIDMTVSGRTPDAQRLLQNLNVNTDGLTTRIGAAEGVAQFQGAADRLAFTANVKAINGTMEASGNLANLLAKPMISDLTLRLRHSDYVDVMRLVSPTFQAAAGISRSLDLFATMRQEGGVYTFSELNASIGPTRVSGDVRADMSGAKPSVTANLQLGEFPVDKIFGIELNNTRGASGGQASDVRWSRNAINTEWMHNFNLALNATASSVSYGPWRMTGGVIEARLRDGTFDLTGLNGQMYGGRLGMTGRMASSAQARNPLNLQGTFALDGVSLEQFVQSFSGARLLRAQGDISLNAEVRATGLSPSALVVSLNGKGTASGRDLVFQGFDLARLSRTLVAPSSSMTQNFTNLLGSALSGGSTRFDTLDSNFDIREGVIRFQKLELAGPEAVVNSQGNVNLPSWTLDIDNVIRLREPEDAPELRVAFRGPLDNPAQTFGQSALENYFMRVIGSRVQERVIDQLQERGGLPGVIGDVLGTGRPQQQPQQQPQPDAAPQGEQQQQQQQQQAPATPEDAFRGLLRGVIEQQIRR